VPFEKDCTRFADVVAIVVVVTVAEVIDIVAVFELSIDDVCNGGNVRISGGVGAAVIGTQLCGKMNEHKNLKAFRFSKGKLFCLTIDIWLLVQL
jgi:hypothetical protein